MKRCHKSKGSPTKILRVSLGGKKNAKTSLYSYWFHLRSMCHQFIIHSPRPLARVHKNELCTQRVAQKRRGDHLSWLAHEIKPLKYLACDNNNRRQLFLFLKALSTNEICRSRHHYHAKESPRGIKAKPDLHFRWLSAEQGRLKHSRNIQISFSAVNRLWARDYLTKKLNKKLFSSISYIFFYF